MGEKIWARLKNPEGNMGGRPLVWLCLTISCLLVPAFVICVHLPLQQAASEYRSEAAKASREINTVVNFQNAHRDRKAYQKELEARRQLAYQAIPENIGQASFLLDMERKAGQAHLQLLLIQPGELVQTDGRQSLPVHLRVQGSYFSLLTFMRELQNGERLVTVQDLGIKLANGQLQVDLLVNIYAVPDK